MSPTAATHLDTRVNPLLLALAIFGFQPALCPIATPINPEQMALTIAAAIVEAHFLSSGEPVRSAFPHQKTEASTKTIASIIIKKWIRRLCFASSAFSCRLAAASSGVSLSMLRAYFPFPKSLRSI
jgi:hypothetical protein